MTSGVVPSPRSITLFPNSRNVSLNFFIVTLKFDSTSLNWDGCPSQQRNLFFWPIRLIIDFPKIREIIIRSSLFPISALGKYSVMVPMPKFWFHCNSEDYEKQSLRWLNYFTDTERILGFTCFSWYPHTKSHIYSFKLTVYIDFPDV